MLKKFFDRHHKVITAVIFICAVITLMGNFHSAYWEHGLIDDYFKSELSINIDKDLPYRDYEKVQDSISNLKEVRVRQLKGTGDQIVLGPIGIREISDCDDCNTLEQYESGKEKFYLELPNYQLEKNAVFLIQNGNYFLKYTVWGEWDPTSTGFGRNGHYEIKKIPIRYAYNDEDKNPHGSILVPISSTWYRFLNILFIIVQIVVVLVSLYITISGLQFLYRIAIGNAFDFVNIWNLYFTSWVLIGIGLITPIVSLAINLFMKSKLPPEIHFDFWGTFLEHEKILIAGIIVLLFANAFKRGYKLQQEQDLTI